MSSFHIPGGRAASRNTFDAVSREIDATMPNVNRMEIEGFVERRIIASQANDVRALQRLLSDIHTSITRSKVPAPLVHQSETPTEIYTTPVQAQ